MRQLEKIEILEINSDSAASEYERMDREIDLENAIIERINETVTDENQEEKKMKKFSRLEQKMEVQPRQYQMAEQLIEI